jgi:hypothetical protein
MTAKKRKHLQKTYFPNNPPKAKKKSRTRVLHVPERVLKKARAEAARITQRFVTEDIVWVPMERRRAEEYRELADDYEHNAAIELHNLLDLALTAMRVEEKADVLLLTQLKARAMRTSMFEERSLYYALNIAITELQSVVDLSGVGC